jgi:hypothetical protein
VLAFVDVLPEAPDAVAAKLSAFCADDEHGTAFPSSRRGTGALAAAQIAMSLSEASTHR